MAAPAAGAGGQQRAADSPPAVARIAGEVLDVQGATDVGVQGLAVRIARADGADEAAPVDLRIEDSLLSDRFGADYASRAVWALLPDCAAGSDGCGEPIPLSAAHDADSGSWTVSSVPVSSSPMVVAALSSVASPTGTGDFGASALSPSGTWQVSAQTGDFSWSYPLRVPPAPAGPQPSIALSYSSGSVDGKTGSTNNQPSWVGEGWALSTGFVERAYTSCSNDTAGGSPSTGDYCWKGENLTLSLNGRSSVLVRDTTSGAWRLREDDGSRIEQLTGAANGDDNGEHWRLTTQDGTQYTFGLNHLPGWSAPAQDTQSTWTVPVFGNDPGEPCSTGTFATSWCQQAWRWNLDYVVDTHANSEAFYYAPETNQYGRNLSATTPTIYTRGGTLARIDYAMRAGSELTSQAPARVVFDIADRCVTPGATCTSGTPANWPDVPWDRNCTGSPCTGNLSPTFWSTKRLSAVRTQIYSVGGGTYGNVDTWALTQTYPDPGDTTSASLWLSRISHTGNVGGTATVPDVEISGSSSANRVRAVDGLLPLVKWRVSSIKTESGAVISVNYSAKECSNTVLPASAETNTMRCFPQWWTPPVGPAKLDYFHKYVVTSVIADAVTGGAQPTDQTYYDYTGTPAWHYDDSVLTPDDKRTWSEYHGYSAVRIRHGDLNTPAKQAVTDYRFFQGMNGDRLNPAGGTKSITVPASDASSWADDRWLQGRTREQITYNGVGGPVVTGTITDPWASAPTATNGAATARYVNDADSRTRLALASGWRNTRTLITYNGDGLPTAVDDLGDTAIGSDDRCTRTSYAPNTTAWITAAPYQVTTVGVSCGATPALPADALADVRTYYDNAAAASTPPTQGSPTRVEVVKSYTGAVPNWLTTTTAYDALGRATTTQDALGHIQTTSYAPATGLVTSSTTTNTLLWTTTTALRPEWGSAASVVDANGKTTAATYDALGRRTGMWATDRPQATYPASPTVAYGYTVSNSAPTVVTTATLNSTGGTNTSYALFDGLLRARQSQSPSQGGGTVVTDTLYDAAGRVESTHAGYWITTAPSGTLYSASLSLIPARTVRQFDGAGRETANILYVLGAERWRTSTAYYGDHTDVTPPAGASAASTYTDARGNITARIQWQTNAPSGLHDDTYYGYDRAGRLTAISDPAGNAWSYGYDTLGRKTTAHDPDAGDSSYTYDDGGRMLTSTDGRGQVLAYVYDNLDRKTELHTSTAAGTLLASWAYDTLAKGQPTASIRYDATGQYKTETTGYDDAYRSLGQKVTIPALASLATTYTSTNTYWPDGSLKSTALPAMGGLPAETLRWGYTAIGLPYTFSGPSLISYVNTAVYTHTGLLAQLNQNGPGTTTVKNLYYEDGTDRLQRTVASSYSAGAGAIEDRNYSYDNAGNTTKIKNDGTGTSGVSDTQCLGYDYLRQLTQAWTPTSTSCASAPTSTTLGGPAPYWKTYNSTKIGNRTQDVVNPITSGGATTTTTYSYPASGASSVRPHAVTSQSVAVSPGSTTATAFGYDNAGNTTSRATTQTFTYNAEGRQSGYSAGTSGPTSSSIYDASGERITYTDPTGTTLYLGGTEIKSTTAGLSAVRTYTFRGQTIAVRASTAGVSGTVMSWIDPDHQNSATVATNSTTGVKTRRYNDPYGNARGAVPSFPGGHGFLDMPVDALSTTAHLGAREYVATSGRFLQPDPILRIHEPNALNRYAYSRNNPATLTDADGLDPVTQACARGDRANCNNSRVDRGVPIEDIPSADPPALSAPGRTDAAGPAAGQPGTGRSCPANAAGCTDAHGKTTPATWNDPNGNRVHAMASCALGSQPCLAAQTARDVALQEARKRFHRDNPQDNDATPDAFLHAYWAALLAGEAGAEKAEWITTWYETFDPSNPYDAAHMDVANDLRGVRAFQTFLDQYGKPVTVVGYDGEDSPTLVYEYDRQALADYIYDMAVSGKLETLQK